jgi:hypothetical protein
MRDRDYGLEGARQPRDLQQVPGDRVRDGAVDAGRVQCSEAALLKAGFNRAGADSSGFQVLRGSIPRSGFKEHIRTGSLFSMDKTFDIFAYPIIHGARILFLTPGQGPIQPDKRSMVILKGYSIGECFPRDPDISLCSSWSNIPDRSLKFGYDPV